MVHNTSSERTLRPKPCFFSVAVSAAVPPGPSSVDAVGRQAAGKLLVAGKRSVLLVFRHKRASTRSSMVGASGSSSVLCWWCRLSRPHSPAVFLRPFQPESVFSCWPVGCLGNCPSDVAECKPRRVHSHALMVSSPALERATLLDSTANAFEPTAEAPSKDALVPMLCAECAGLLPHRASCPDPPF